ncbi:ParB N-terminal domain-containing protein [Leptolyngbya sp. FACHB-671]|uniref:ParB N-terminal domain-containing protein n=1 Tax=Leptolyngbya sp. FACHB-671 TaxID=2692812 RepID=UPI0016827C34|nr:ParB N-terminal domain-containing protein [Leptolyngbya sp. FACHB-671]MBD2066199.1 ParB N-terminal domain-containing protein [Leptolyngbya sp. FACHB-671]
MTNFDKILAKAREKKDREQEKEQPQQQRSGIEATIPLDDIKDRVAGDTRPLDQKHVEELAESIAAIGLVQAVTVDAKGRLLAGGHRRAAIHLLREQNRDAYKRQFPNDRVPVRVMDFDSQVEPDRSLEVELSENEKRRDYSRTEVVAIAEKLRAAGYQDTPGRPKKGEKRLKPALSVIFGKSLRTVERYLSEPETPTSGEVFPSKLLKQALPKLKQWQQSKPKTPAEKELAASLSGLIELIEAVLQEQSES